MEFQGYYCPGFFILGWLVTSWSRVGVDYRSDRFRGIPLHAGGHVRVGVQRDVDAAVAEAFLNDFGMNAGFESECCPRVPKIVEPNWW